MEWFCYILMSQDKKHTYIGKTNDIHRRLRQHNGEISGGAKSTRKHRPWHHICLVSGFKSEIEALRFEYMMKRFKRSNGLGRFNTLNSILSSDRLYQKLEDPFLTIRVVREYRHLMGNFDCALICYLDKEIR